jgi:hypothetical protein
MGLEIVAMALLESKTDYISEKDLAKQLGVRFRGKPYNVRTLIEWRRRKAGPPAKQVGSIWIYYIPHLEAWLQRL